MKLKKFANVLMLGAILLLVIPTDAVQAKVTEEDYKRAEQFLPRNAGKLIFKAEVIPNWINGSDRFWYRNNTRTGTEFILVNPKNKTRRPTFDHGKKEKSEKKIARDEILSPDGRWAAFVKDHNLYVRSTDTGKETRLTGDGEAYYDYAGTPDAGTFIFTDRIRGNTLPPPVLWSPDSKKLATHRLDQRGVKELHLLQSVPAKGHRTVVHSYRVSLPGDKKIPLAEMLIFDVERKKKITVDTAPLLAHFFSPVRFKYVWWSKKSDKIYFLREERGNKVLKLHAADAVTGTTQTLIEERGATYVEAQPAILMRPNVRVLGNGSEIIWFSERDGWGHLYLYDGGKGTLKNRVTSGPWLVYDIIRVDEKQRWVYFTGCGREKGRNPYLRHLYRVKLDGSNLQLLTPENADHRVTFSPGGKYFVDTYSRVDAAPVSVLRSADGKSVLKLEEADIGPLLDAGMKWPEPFKVKARDGITDIYGALYRPSNFDKNKKYPVLDSIYPGPQTIRSSRRFSLGGSGIFFSLAELGFIVVSIDGMGTPFRSKAFHDFSYGNLGDIGGLEDHIAGLKQLAARYPCMDLNRVGIFGGSGGGYASTRAMLTRPDFYTTAVSISGSHDIRCYTSYWGEKYQGIPEGDNYKYDANVDLAQNLKGKLLLVYSDMDSNVNPIATVQLVDALIRANKDFDLLLLPNNTHSYTKYRPYLYRKVWDYFVENLLGMEPPKGYIIRK